MRCYRCKEYDHFASECPNTPTDRETDCEDTDAASLQMILQDQGDNPYKRVVLNNVYKIPEKCPEMKNWSIFSDNVRYVQHDQRTTQNLNFDTLDYRNHKDLYLQLK